ncbi:hypothetical protein QAD02_002821 [Eretmocerus hayati]|uniref:Uncharacterized protein n=1 Tax=Eretmocerus hayati TaxID=131215 RepID=A0ACC2NMV9_9HYME|nr:hypothetical protein QAD02_002821 [Eretmocerus hayati]
MMAEGVQEIDDFLDGDDIAQMELDQNEEHGGQAQVNLAPVPEAVNDHPAGPAAVPLAVPRPGPGNAPGAHYVAAPAAEPQAVPRLHARNSRPRPEGGQVAAPQNQQHLVAVNNDGHGGAAGGAPVHQGGEAVGPGVGEVVENQESNGQQPYRGRRARQEVQARRRSRRMVGLLADILYESKRGKL